MYYDFVKEVNALNKCGNIDDKAKIVSVYYDFFHSVFNCIYGICSKYTIKMYQDFLTDRFLMVIRFSEARRERVTCESFLGNFFYYVENNPNEEFKPIGKIVEFYRENLGVFLDGVAFLDELGDEEFINQVNILILFKEYYRWIEGSLLNLYGNEGSFGLRSCIYNNLCSVVPNLIKISDDKDEYMASLRGNARNIFLDINKKGAFDFLSTDNEVVSELFGSFDDEERYVFKILLAVRLAGCGIREMSYKNLDISDKISLREYDKVMLGILRKIIKWRGNVKRSYSKKKEK